MNTPRRDRKRLKDLDMGPDTDADGVEDLEVEEVEDLNADSYALGVLGGYQTGSATCSSLFF